VILVIALLFTSSFSLFTPTILSAPAPIEDGSEMLFFENDGNESVERTVNLYFSDIPIMTDIARCESEFRHFGRDGEVLRGEKIRSDVGVMQINEYYHAKTADALGINIYSLGGNMVYARYLYDSKGTSPWLSSVRCWGRENHIAKY